MKRKPLTLDLSLGIIWGAAVLAESPHTTMPHGHEEHARLKNPFPLSEWSIRTGEEVYAKWEDRAGLAYTISKNYSLVGQWHSNFGWGGGLQARF